MFEGVLEKLLLKLFGEYVEEFNRDQLHVSIWAGDVVLTDLKLKVGALDSFRLPIEVLHGQISTLTIKIPWTRISSSPVQITIDGLYVLCGPQRSKPTVDTADEPTSDIEAGVASAAKMAWTLKQRLLEQHEQKKLAAEEEGDQKQNQGYTARIISKIISNLQLTVKHVHLRYEDSTTLTTTTSSGEVKSQSFAAGFTIGELIAQTTDSRGAVAFVSDPDSSGGGVTHKVVHLRNGAVYWNSDHVGPLWHDLPMTEKLYHLKRLETGPPKKEVTTNYNVTRPSVHIVTQTSAAATTTTPHTFNPTNPFGYDYILHPLDITMRAILHHGDNDTELVKVQEAEHQLALANRVANDDSNNTSSPSSSTSTSSASIPAIAGGTITSPTSKYFLSFTLPHLSLQLRSSQYRDCVRILDHFSQVKVNQTIATRMAKLPKFPPRDIGPVGVGGGPTGFNLDGTPTRRRSRASSVASSSAPGSPKTISEASESEVDFSDEDEDEFLSADEFESPILEPASLPPAAALTASHIAQLELSSSATPSTLSFRHILRPAWCRPYWRHAIKCLILLKSRRSRLDWNSVREYSQDRVLYTSLWLREYPHVSSSAYKQVAAAGLGAGFKIEPLTKDERLQMRQIEQKRSFESIVVFRAIAEQQFKLAIKMVQAKVKTNGGGKAAGKDAKSSTAEPLISPDGASSSTHAPAPGAPGGPPGKKGWWGMLGFKQSDLSGGGVGGVGSGSAAIDSEVSKLLASITLTPEQQRKIWEQEQRLPLFFKRLEVQVRLVGADFRLTQPRSSHDSSQIELTRICWDGSLHLVQRLKNWSARVCVTKMEVWDMITENTCFKQVLSSGETTHTQTHADPHTATHGEATSTPVPSGPPLLSFDLEDSPRLLDSSSSADFRVVLRLRPISVVISPLYLSKLMDFFYEKDTTAYLWAAAANWEKHARNELLTALTDHREMDLDVQVLQPTLILPIDCLKKTSTVLVGDLHTLRMVSRPPLIHQQHGTKNVKQLNHSASSSPQLSAASTVDEAAHAHSHSHSHTHASHQAGVDGDTFTSEVHPVNPLAYDSFQLHFQSCRLYTCASVEEWHESSQSASRGVVDTAKKSSLLYIVDGAVTEDEPTSANPPSAPSSGASTTAFDPPSPSTMSHHRAGFDVSLVMYTCIDRFEKLRLKHARDKEKERQKLIAELTARGDTYGLECLEPLPISHPLSKILIQGSLPKLNLSICASTLEVIRTLKEQLLNIFFQKFKQRNNSGATSAAASSSSGVGVSSKDGGESQTLLQLANESNAGAGGRKNHHATGAESTTATSGSSIGTVRNTFECGFLIDRLSVNILRDRVARNARAAAKSNQSIGIVDPLSSPLSYLNPHAPPLFLIDITRIGGMFLTNSSREIHCAFELASIRILDLFQNQGRQSRFAYLATSEEPPLSQEETDMKAYIASQHRTTDTNTRVESAAEQQSRTDDRLDHSFSHALAQSMSPSSSSVLSTLKSFHRPPPPPRTHLIRITYKYLFHPLRTEHTEWTALDSGPSEEEFLEQVSNPTSPDSHGMSSTIENRNVTSFIHLDFNTLYVNWNPNTIAAVLAYMRYDEGVQSDKETKEVLQQKPNTTNNSIPDKELDSKEDAATEKETSVHLPAGNDSNPPAATSAAPPAAAAAASGQPPPSVLKKKSTKRVRLFGAGPSSSAPLSIISPMAASWSSAHKNITILTARLNKLSVNFNKESEGRALWRLEMVHSRVQHRHVIHPSPFLFYLMTSAGTGHRSKKEKDAQGFISNTNRDLAIAAKNANLIHTAPTSPTPNSPAHVTPPSTTNIAPPQTPYSAHLSREPIHTFSTRGALGNVQLYDLDLDKRIKYREMLGVRPMPVASSSHARSSSSSSSSTRSSSVGSSPISVMDFVFSSHQLEVVQRREWYIRRLKEIAWIEEGGQGEFEEEKTDQSGGSSNFSTPSKNATQSRDSSTATNRFPSMPDFADTHLLLHVNALQLVYLQQPTMEFIDFFNEGIIGAFQARLRKRAAVSSPIASAPPVASQPDKYHKLSLTLSNPQVVVPRNSTSNTHLLAGLRQIRVTNTVSKRRIILGIDVKGGTINSSELNADGSYPPIQVPHAFATDSSGTPTPAPSKPAMMELECFVTCILPQPDHLRQPQNEKYFDSITEIDARHMKGTMSWEQYVLLLNVFNENIRAPPPVRPKLKMPVSEVDSASRKASSGAPNLPVGLTPVKLPIASFNATPTLNDAPTVTYHVFDERPPLTLDIRLNISLAQIRFLLGSGSVLGEFGEVREDGLTEVSIQDISYTFQSFSSRHMHMVAKIHSVTMVDLRQSSKSCPFKAMICPFSQIRDSRRTDKTTFAHTNSGQTNGAHAQSEAELEYVQHDWPTGERDMQMSVYKPCGFVIPDFWMDFVSGFLFTANDSAFASQHAMIADWSRAYFDVHGEAPSVGPRSPNAPNGGRPAPSPRALSTHTGANLPGYTPHAYTTPKRPFRCFQLNLKNSRFILLEDLTFRQCRALVTTCDASMTYTSEEQQQYRAPPSDLPKGQPGDWWTAWEWKRKIDVSKLRMFVCASATNPVINAAHSVVTPLNVLIDQSFKTEKRYYEPRSIQFHVNAENGPGRPPTSRSNSTTSNTSRTLSRSSSSSLLHSPLRLEVHDQLFFDVVLSSASGSADEPIELRASYQDFKLITHCLESLQDQQTRKKEHQEQVKEREERRRQELIDKERFQRAQSSTALHSLYTNSSGSMAGIDPLYSSTGSSSLFDSGSDLDSQPSGSQTPIESSSSSPTAVASPDGCDTFNESVKMLHIIWKNQLTFVVINDCFQRYVPLLHARILAGDALCIAKRKELDDEEKDEDDDDEDLDEADEEEMDEDGAPNDAQRQTALERAKSFLQKLKSGNAQTSIQADPPAPSKRSRSLAIRNVVDFKTVALTLLLEVTYFNPKVVCWEPFLEPCQFELKMQYETPNIKNHVYHQHHSASFGQVGMSGTARRRMRGAVVVHNNQTNSGASENNVPAWTINLTCATRINVNISYVFLQHLYTTLQSWSVDFDNSNSNSMTVLASGAAASPIAGGEDNKNASGASPNPATNTKSSNSAQQAFSPYFIRNLTGGEIQYRCRNIMRESAASRSATGVAHGASSAFALHDKLTLHSEFAANPASFLSHIGPQIKKRVTSYASLAAAAAQQAEALESVTPDATDEDEPNTHRMHQPDDGLESVHVLAAGAEEQLSLRLITGGVRPKKGGDGGDDDTEYSAEDDVYRSILASRAPFSLRVRLAGGWIALNDLVVNKVGTTSYILQMDPNADDGTVTITPAAATAATQAPLIADYFPSSTSAAGSQPHASLGEVLKANGGPAGALSESGHPLSASATRAPISMLHLTQLDRKQLLFVDVVLRDGSKIVTLRSPTELVNRTNKPLCFLLHAHPTTPRRQAAALASPASYPDWQRCTSAFLHSKDAFAVLGPVPAGGTINVPFSLTHLDYVSVMPTGPRISQSKRTRRVSSDFKSGLNVALDGAATMASSAAAAASDADDEWLWSDTPLSQSALIKAVHDQAARYTAAHASAPPPGVVARLQCIKAKIDSSISASSTHRWRADSSFLLHVQAVHGSGASAPPPSGEGAGAGENLLTLSLVFTPPLILRNLFPYGMDFRLAYTRNNPPTALMNQTHQMPIGGHSATNVLSVAGQKAPLTPQQKALDKAQEKEDKERLAAQSKAQKVLERAEAKNPSGSSMPGRLDQTHPHTNGKARYELWGHLASGQHLYYDHVNLDRDPYIMFRLDGFGWSERIPLVHLNQEDMHEENGGVFSPPPAPSATNAGEQHDYTVSAYNMKQHIARHYVTIEDNNGNPLIAQLESRRAGPHGGGLELDLYVQYWLINRTGLDLLYGSRIHMSDSEEGARSVIRTLPGHGGRVELCTYENQRYSVLDGWTSPFLPTDRPAWSDDAGNDRPKDWFRLPADDGSWMFEGDWRIDYGHAAPIELISGGLLGERQEDVPVATGQRTTDANGWEYSIDFPWSFHPKNATMDAVRRRRWIRSYVSTRTLKPLCLHSTNMRGFKEELCVRISPVTRGSDYHKEMHTKSGSSAPLLRTRSSESAWSMPFTASGQQDGLLEILETQQIDVANDVDLEHAQWKRAAAHVMAMADQGLEKGKFQLQGDEAELGPLAPHVQPRDQYTRENRYDIGVAFQPCPGIFYRSQMISFTPRFLLVNQLPYTLFFRQAGAHHRGRIPVLHIEAGKFQPFWWVDVGVQPIGAEKAIKGQPGVQPPTPTANADNKQKQTSAEFEARRQHARKQNTDFESLASIAFASTAAVRWRWTGAFPIDEVGELSIACRSSMMTSRFLRVKVMLEGATVFVVFKEENRAKPRYRLDNHTDCPMWYRQKLPYVNETREQILNSLPVPNANATHPNTALQPPTATAAPAATSPTAIMPLGSPQPQPSAAGSSKVPAKPALLGSDSLSPWLYLGPGESTPFAWQEILVPKPYLLEVLTCTPYVDPSDSTSPTQSWAQTAEKVRAASPPSYIPPTLAPTPAPAHAHLHPSTAASAVISRTTRDMTPNQKKRLEREARARFNATVRARVGPYDFHFCDSVQLDEIGYSLISMDSQTFIDVYVADDESFDSSPPPSSGPSSGSGSSSSGSGAKNPPKSSSIGSSTTKVMKLVRKHGMRDLGLAEAAAVLKQEERVRARSRADSEGVTSSSRSDRSDSNASDADEAPSKQRRDRTTSNANDIPPDYVPVHRRELQVEKTSLFFEFVLPKLSISLIDHLPRELALLSLRDFKLTYSKSNIYQKMELLLGDIQIDNQMSDAMFNVVLHQKPDTVRRVGQTHQKDKKNAFKHMVQRSMKANIDASHQAPRPFLHLSCIRLTKYSSLEHYKYFGLLVQEFVLKLDQSFILACIPFLDVFYNARFQSQGTIQENTMNCTSMEDLERELGIPLANEDEYALMQAPQQATKNPLPSPPQSDAKSALSSKLEGEFEVQVSQLSHLRAVLATLESKLAIEGGIARTPAATPEQKASLRRLEDEIARMKQQYHRLLEENLEKAREIQNLSKYGGPATDTGRVQPQLSPMPTNANASTQAASPYRAAHVSSISSSWMEGADQKRSSQKTRHANPASRIKRPYQGWKQPTTNTNTTVTTAASNSAATGGSLSSGSSSSSSSSALIAPASPVPLSSTSSSAASVWVQANSSQNVQVVRTLTALVNRTLGKATTRAARLREKLRAKKSKSKDRNAPMKRIEEDELDQIYYLENVEINSVQCVFSFFTLPSSSSHRKLGPSRGAASSLTSADDSSAPTWFITLGFGSHDSNPELLSAQTQALANAISSKTLMIANAEDAHLKLTGLHITHSFTTISDMTSLLTKHYTRQLSMQLFELVGASHVLGNPIGLISNLGTGVFDLVNEPISGAIKGPAAFGKGVAVGVGSFFKYSVRGVASTASSLLGTMGNASATLTADPEYLRRRKLGRIRQPKHLASGLMDGTRHLAKGVYDGVTGIFTAPVDGAMSEGAFGFMKGIGRGLLGVVVKPMTGVFDAVTTVSEGIKNTTTLFDKRVLPQRPPRILYGPDQLIRVYSSKELSASCFLDTKSNIRLAGHQRETYHDHFTLDLPPSKMMLKDNDARIKLQMKDDINDAAAGSEPDSPRSLARSDSDADLLALDLDTTNTVAPSSMHLTPSTSRGGPPRSLSSSSGSSSTAIHALAQVTGQETWTIAFILTDHSLVGAKLDMKGNMSASQSNSSSSSSRASAHVPHGGGNISALISSSNSSSSPSVSKYARLLFSFLWIQVYEIERRGSTLTLKFIVSRKQSKDLRKNERLKLLFPIAFEPTPTNVPQAAFAAFSSSTSYFSTARATPLILRITIPCPADDAARIESLLRLATVRAQAEGGRRDATGQTQSDVVLVRRAQIERQIAAQQAASEDEEETNVPESHR